MEWFNRHESIYTEKRIEQDHATDSLQINTNVVSENSSQFAISFVCSDCNCNKEFSSYKCLKIHVNNLHPHLKNINEILLKITIKKYESNDRNQDKKINEEKIKM